MHLRKLAMAAAVLFLVVPVWAKPNPIGTVSICQAATVRGVNLAPGATIFSGDIIEVGPQGGAWIALRGGGQVHIFENSSVRLTKTTDSIELNIDRGNAQTSGKVTVVNSSATESKHESTDDKKDKDKDDDCDVSKHKKHKEHEEDKDHCKDDRD